MNELERKLLTALQESNWGEVEKIMSDFMSNYKFEDHLEGKRNEFTDIDFFKPVQDKDSFADIFRSINFTRSSFNRYVNFIDGLPVTKKTTEPDLKKLSEDLNNHLTNEDPASETPLRPTQKEALEKASEAFSKGQKKIFYKLHTGLGKTPTQIAMAKQGLKQGKVIIVVPRKNLVEQFHDEFKVFAPELFTSLDKEEVIDGAKSGGLVSDELGVIYSNKKDYGKNVTIITYQSLLKLVEQGKITPEEYGMIIWDEAHEVLQGRRTTLVDRFSNSVQVGFTATPKYNDVKSLETRFGTKPLMNVTIAQGSRNGSASSFINVISAVDIQGLDDPDIMTASGNYNQEKLDKVMKEASAATTDAITKYAGYVNTEYNVSSWGKQGLVFCTSIDHAEMVAKAFNSKLGEAAIKDFGADVKVCEVIHSRMSQADKDGVLLRYKQGKTLLIANVDMLTMGFDDKYIDKSTGKIIREGGYTSVVINLSPTKSLVDAEQRGGRATRLWKENLHKIALIFDIIPKSKIEGGTFASAKMGKSQPITFAAVAGGEVSIVTDDAKEKNKFEPIKTASSVEFEYDPDQNLVTREEEKAIIKANLGSEIFPLIDPEDKTIVTNKDNLLSRANTADKRIITKNQADAIFTRLEAKKLGKFYNLDRTIIPGSVIDIIDSDSRIDIKGLVVGEDIGIGLNAFGEEQVWVKCCDKDGNFDPNSKIGVFFIDRIATEPEKKPVAVDEFGVTNKAFAKNPYELSKKSKGVIDNNEANDLYKDINKLKERVKGFYHWDGELKRSGTITFRGKELEVGKDIRLSEPNKIHTSGISIRCCDNNGNFDVETPFGSLFSSRIFPNKSYPALDFNDKTLAKLEDALEISNRSHSNKTRLYQTTQEIGDQLHKCYDPNGALIEGSEITYEDKKLKVGIDVGIGRDRDGTKIWVKCRDAEGTLDPKTIFGSIIVSTRGKVYPFTDLSENDPRIKVDHYLDSHSNKWIPVSQKDKIIEETRPQLEKCYDANGLLIKGSEITYRGQKLKVGEDIGIGRDNRSANDFIWIKCRDNQGNFDPYSPFGAIYADSSRTVKLAIKYQGINYQDKTLVLDAFSLNSKARDLVKTVTDGRDILDRELGIRSLQNFYQPDGNVRPDSYVEFRGVKLEVGKDVGIGLNLKDQPIVWIRCCNESGNFDPNSKFGIALKNPRTMLFEPASARTAPLPFPEFDPNDKTIVTGREGIFDRAEYSNRTQVDDILRKLDIDDLKKFYNKDGTVKPGSYIDIKGVKLIVGEDIGISCSVTGKGNISSKRWIRCCHPDGTINSESNFAKAFAGFNNGVPLAPRLTAEEELAKRAKRRQLIEKARSSAIPPVQTESPPEPKKPVWAVMVDFIGKNADPSKGYKELGIETEAVSGKKYYKIEYTKNGEKNPTTGRILFFDPTKTDVQWTDEGNLKGEIDKIFNGPDPKLSKFGVGEEIFKKQHAANVALVLLNYAKGYYWSDKDPQMASMYMSMGNHGAGVMGGFMGAQFLAGSMKLEEGVLQKAAIYASKYKGIGAGVLSGATSSKFFQNIPLVGMASTYACYYIAGAHAPNEEVKRTLEYQCAGSMIAEGTAIAYIGKTVGVTGVAISETFNQFYYNANRDKGAMPSLITTVTNEAGNLGLKPVYDLFNNRMVTSSEHVLDGEYAKTSLYTINSFDEKGVARSEIFPVIKLEGDYQEKAQAKVVGNVPQASELENFRSDGSSRKSQKWEEFDPEFKAAVNSKYVEIRTEQFKNLGIDKDEAKKQATFEANDNNNLNIKLSTVLSYYQNSPASWSGHLYKQYIEDYLKYCETEDVGTERFINYYRDLNNSGEYYKQYFNEKGITNFKLPDFYVRGDIFPAEPILDPKLTELGVSFVGDEEGFKNLSYTAKMAVIREAVEQSALVPYNNADGRFLWDIDGLPAKSADKAAETERLAKAQELYGLYASHMGSEAHANYTVRLDDFRTAYAGAYVEPVNQMERSFKLLAAEESLNHLQMAIGGISEQFDIINGETLKADPDSKNLIDTYPQDREDLNTRIKAFKQKARGLKNYEMTPELQKEFEEIQREQMYLLDCYQPYFKEISKDVEITMPDGNIVNPAGLQKMEQELGYNVSNPSPSSPTPANENGTSKHEETKTKNKGSGTDKSEKEPVPAPDKDKEEESPFGKTKTSYTFEISDYDIIKFADGKYGTEKWTIIRLPDGIEINVTQRDLGNSKCPIDAYRIEGINSPLLEGKAPLEQAKILREALQNYLNGEAKDTNGNTLKDRINNPQNKTDKTNQLLQLQRELRDLNSTELKKLSKDTGSIEVRENSENGKMVLVYTETAKDLNTEPARNIDVGNISTQDQAREKLKQLFADNKIYLQNLLPPRYDEEDRYVGSDFQYLSSLLNRDDSKNAGHSQKGLKEVEAVDEYGNKTTANANEFLEEFTSVLWHFKESGNLEKFIGSSSFEDIKQTLAKGALAEEISEGSETTLNEIITQMSNIQRQYATQPETLASSPENPKPRREK